MKNSPLSALVMVGIAALVGSVTYFATGDDRIEVDPEAIQAPVRRTPTVMSVSPKAEQRERRLAEFREQIEEYKRTGVVLENGAIKTLDLNGTELFVHPELIEGTGRYGEPLYMMATYKSKPGVPLKRKFKAPKVENVASMRKLRPGKTPLTVGKKPGGQAKGKGLDVPGNTGGSGGGGNKGAAPSNSDDVGPGKLGGG